MKSDLEELMIFTGKSLLDCKRVLKECNGDKTLAKQKLIKQKKVK